MRGDESVVYAHWPSEPLDSRPEDPDPSFNRHALVRGGRRVTTGRTYGDRVGERFDLRDEYPPFTLRT